MSKSNVEKIAPFAEMIGDVDDAKIAEMAGVTEAAVAKFRESANTEPLQPKPAPKPAAKPAVEVTAEHDASARGTALEAAAEALLAKGWRLVDGELVPPTVRPREPELVIRLKAGVRLKGRAANGKEVDIPLARSLYRGAMARRVIELVGEDSGLIERIAG